MTSDDFKHASGTGSSPIPLATDIELLEATRLFQNRFTKSLFWRDLREIGTALLLIPLWLFLGQELALPWTWYLMVPVLVWIAGYLWFARRQRKPRRLEPAESLGGCLQSTLDQVEHQIRLLDNVFWWCLLPLAVPMVAFVAHVVLLAGPADGWTALIVASAVLIIAVVLITVHKLNQSVVHADLLPRREDLRNRLLSLSLGSVENTRLSSG